MTDTTDIKALREECAQWVKEAIGEAVDTRMALNGDGNDYMSWDMSVIWLAWLYLSGKLEAERQRADKNGKMLERVAGQRDKAFTDIEKAEAELAALKGEQVPVAEIKFHPSTDKHPCMYWFGKQDRDFPVGTQFFIAPQKPVVLPSEDVFAELYRLREEIKGPDGFATWKDAAIAERVKNKSTASILPIEGIDYLTAMTAFHSDDWHKMGAVSAYMKGWNARNCLLPTPINKVVWPEYRCSPDMHTKQYYETVGFNRGLDACKAAIEAAGGIVKDGE